MPGLRAGSPVQGIARGNHAMMFLSLSLPPPLNKSLEKPQTDLSHTQAYGMRGRAIPRCCHLHWQEHSRVQLPSAPEGSHTIVPRPGFWRWRDKGRCRHGGDTLAQVADSQGPRDRHQSPHNTITLGAGLLWENVCARVYMCPRACVLGAHSCPKKLL